MEYTQWVLSRMSCCYSRTSVLILVVMEYTQWETIVWRKTKKKWVLILVVMEYTQWVSLWWMRDIHICLSLNPCCNGIYSMRIV